MIAESDRMIDHLRKRGTGAHNVGVHAKQRAQAVVAQHHTLIGVEHDQPVRHGVQGGGQPGVGFFELLPSHFDLGHVGTETL